MIAKSSGGMLHGFANAWSLAVSLALQYGMPVEKFVEKHRHVSFEPSGNTTLMGVPTASSIVDMIAQFFEARFMHKEVKPCYVPIPSDSLVFLNGDGSGRPGFSFWDTVTEGYVVIDNAMAWETWEDFARDWNYAASCNESKQFPESWTALDRFEALVLKNDVFDYPDEAAKAVEMAKETVRIAGASRDRAFEAYDKLKASNIALARYLQEYIITGEGHGCPDCGEPDVDLAKRILIELLVVT